VENIGNETTQKLRFATGMTPMISPLPRTLSSDDRLKTEAVLSGDYINKANTGTDLRMVSLNQEQLLSNILKELKIMNIHLSLMTDDIIERGDVE